ncbi:MAG: hypothetical protein QOG75_4379, partial [Mycobacterium sp.]|nr:hypothetical protein [Mycobacterium sp.]
RLVPAALFRLWTGKRAVHDDYGFFRCFFHLTHFRGKDSTPWHGTRMLRCGISIRTKSAPGQTEKTSRRTNVFRRSRNSGHCRLRSRHSVQNHREVFCDSQNDRLRGYGTFQFRETAAGSHLRTTAALFGRAGVTYVTLMDLPGRREARRGKDGALFSGITRSIFVEESLNRLWIGCFAQR